KENKHGVAPKHIVDVDRINTSRGRIKSAGISHTCDILTEGTKAQCQYEKDKYRKQKPSSEEISFSAFEESEEHSDGEAENYNDNQQKHRQTTKTKINVLEDEIDENQYADARYNFNNVPAYKNKRHVSKKLDPTEISWLNRERPK
ncbi:unnamed protein product, partial [Didymodactylos carnosus]